MTIQQELEIIKKRKERVRIKDILSEYNIKSPKTIYDIIKRNGKNKLKPNKKYILNESFFEVIDDEYKAYWLGFLYADGYVRMKNNKSGELRIKLKYDDKNHIETFRDCISSNHKINDFIQKSSSESFSKVSSLSIYNTKLVMDLFSHGCVNAKTFKIKFPVLKNDLNRHFLRGYFDGDGYITIKKNSNSATVGITSNFDFINGIIRYLNYGKISKRKNIYDFKIYNRTNIEKFYNLLYENSNIFLQRKRNIFDEYLKRNK